MSGALTTTIPRLTDLYPVTTDRRVAAITQNVLTWERDIDGKYFLSRELTYEEREFLRERRKMLAEALVRAQDKEIRKSVSQMLAGFLVGKDIPEENAKATIAQYIVTLRGLPLWAIERACQKFSRGEITIDVIEGVNRAYGPSTAQLYQVASGLVGEFYKELQEVDRAINGVLEYKPTPEEVERVANGLRDLADDLRLKVQTEVEAERAGKRKPYQSFSDDDLRRMYPPKTAKEESANP